MSFTEPVRRTARHSRWAIAILLFVACAALIGLRTDWLSLAITVFDDDVSAVTKLDQDLLDALRQAEADAEKEGIELVINSGWRSASDQEQLLQEAISKYGSRGEAARWVATPETSAHVSGDAVDIGDSAAAAWLSTHGAAYGLCQIYRNEPWHYELRPHASDQGCPPQYEDPTQDPRMQ